MLSRVVVSQVKHNSYFLAGVALGLAVALLAVPLEEAACGADSGGGGGGGDGAADEYAAQRAQGAARGGGGARSVQRPRYYTTELGMRQPLLAAVLTSEEALGAGGAGAALNATLAPLGAALRFFISAPGGGGAAGAAGGGGGGAGRAHVVAFTDAREMLKPFHALKYLADNHLDEYDYFFLASDRAYVNARRLLRLARRLSVSQPVHMGHRAAADSPYCSLEGGVLLSGSVLRAVQGALDWCVRNSYSAHHHENVGRCVLHAAQLPCAERLQRQEYLSVADTGGAEAALWRAVSVRGAAPPPRALQLHALAARAALRACGARRRAAAGALRAGLARAPPGYRNASWPAGLRADPGLRPPPPDNRWDHLRWTSFNATHAFLADDHHAATPLEGVTARAVQLAVSAAVRWAGGGALAEGAWRWTPARDLRYRLLLRAPRGLRRVEVVRPLGAARLVAAPYVTESARVWLVLPAGDEQAALEFLSRYEATCLRRRAHTALVAAVAGAAGAGGAVRARVAALAARHGGAALRAVGAAGAAVAAAAGAVTARAALEAALRETPRDALLLLADARMDFNDEFLNRVRMNCIPGWQWFLPVGFSRFAAAAHPALRAGTGAGARPQTGTGRFNAAHQDVLAVYRADYEAARSLGAADAEPAALLAASGLRCVRAPEPALVRAPPPRPAPAAPAPPAERLDLGARHTLAKLLLEAEAAAEAA